MFIAFYCLFSCYSCAICVFFFYCYGDRRDLHSFPTRRSSDLEMLLEVLDGARMLRQARLAFACGSFVEAAEVRVAFDQRDRKSTRLNSSHANISYAVFCLKKKKVANRGLKMITWLNLKKEELL